MTPDQLTALATNGESDTLEFKRSTGERREAMHALCAYLHDSAHSPVRLYTPPAADIDAVIDVRAVYQQAHRDIALEHLPALLLPHKGRLGLCDYEKVFCVDHKRGHDIFCKHPIAGSFVHGFTEYCTAVCEQVFQIPKNSPIDPKYYCLAEPMASAMDGMDLADIKIGDNVLLQGCGAIGSIILNMLLLKGGANVTVSDPIAEKRETALKLGAQYVIDPKNEDLKERAMEITNGRGYDVIFDVSGVPAAAPLLPKLLANKGTVVYFAVFPMDYELPLNLYDLYIKEGRLQTVFTTIYNYPRVIDLIPRMNLDVIANREMKLSDGVEIFNAFLESKSNKIIVDCQH